MKVTKELVEHGHCESAMNAQPVFTFVTAFHISEAQIPTKLVWPPDSHKSLTLAIHHSFPYVLFTLSLSFTDRKRRTIEQVTYILH